MSKIKGIVARHGIPEILVSDNGSQYTSSEFMEFTKAYKIKHVTSSPGHSSANGEAERAVQTIKDLWETSKDRDAALLMYRSTPLENGASPAELSMSRKLRNFVPILPELLTPVTQDTKSIVEKEENNKLCMKRNFDERRAARFLPVLEKGDEVFITDRQESGVVESRDNMSHQIATPHGNYRRNRVFLNKLPTEDSGTKNSVDASVTGPEFPLQEHREILRRSSREVSAPKRLIEHC